LVTYVISSGSAFVSFKSAASKPKLDFGGFPGCSVAST